MPIKLFCNNKFDNDVFFALKWKKPNSINVIIKKDDNNTYFAKITNLEGNVVTQANTGKELVEMVNEALYDYLKIPVQYRQALGYFLPPEEVRKEIGFAIPDKYLNTTSVFAAS